MHILTKKRIILKYVRHISQLSRPKPLNTETLPKYNSDDVESGWYKWWKENNFFNNSTSKDKFVMVLPPPNVTGSLHIGHALTCTLQDIIARWHRMSGKDVVWIPGCDHAGIATQGIVERHLWNTQSLNRHDIGRQKFVEEIWKWCHDKESIIQHQLQRLGASLDWSRSVFTLDDNMSHAVTEAFIELDKAGLIYRNNAMINWCCRLQSVISDIEVDHQEILGPTHVTLPGYSQPVMMGKLYTISYPVADSNAKIEVSTTRPETMLGDTAIMVHPDDPKYKDFHNKSVFHVFRQENIPIICDTSVNPKFGTGAVKVTPGHSHADYNVSLQHNLPVLTVINDNGTINHLGGEFQGQQRFLARDNIINELDKMGLYVKSEGHKMMLPRCSRTQDVIEPLLKPQWFLKTKQMVEKAKEAAEHNQLTIIPDYQKNIWLDWTKKEHIDWCISRQLWWGHQIPAYKIDFKDGTSTYLVARSLDHAKENILNNGYTEDQIALIQQEEDVLDTWFSSSLFPFATLGWPRTNNNDYDKYYPTSLLVTGRDILFFWVMRMVMMGQQLTGILPFNEVFAHGLVFDSEGRKMSKSKGNVIDPMNIITPADLKESSILQTNRNATKCGADALRLTLSSLDIKEEVLKFDSSKLETYTNFTNKIWNTFRFFLKYHHEVPESINYLKHVNFNERFQLSLINKWILGKLAFTIETVHNDFVSYDINNASQSLYTFWYENLCDVYLEAIKPVLQSNSNEEEKKHIFSTLWTCLHEGLVMFSPIMPYITEELYQYLPCHHSKYQSILQCKYPQPSEIKWCQDIEIEKVIDKCLPIAQSLKYLKVSYNLQSTKNIMCTILTSDEDLLNYNNEIKGIIATLGRISALNINSTLSQDIPSKCITTPVSSSTNVYLHLEGIIDINKELHRLHNKLTTLRSKEAKLDKRVSRSRKDDKVTNKLKETKEKIQQIEEIIENLKNA